MPGYAGWGGRLILALLCLLLLAGCSAEEVSSGAYSGTLVLEGRHAYASGTTLPGVLVVLGGEATLEQGARVDGPVFLLGGSLEVNGEIEGDVSLIGGRLEVGPGARVTGDVRAASGQVVSISPQAEVEGEVLRGPASGLEPSDVFPQRSLGPRLIWMAPEALILGGLAYLASRYAPGAVGNVRRAALRHPLVSAAMGLLAGVVGLVLLVVMAFTLILIPVTLLGFAVGFLAIGYGYVGIGSGAGRRLGAGRGWSRERAAFAGTFALSLALNLVSLLPVVGGLVGILAALVALGAVTLTRFGLRDFVPAFDWGEEEQKMESRE